MPDPIARIRRFNRAVTAEAGALDASYLGRGRPLGVARVLCSLAPEGTEVGEVRARLGLDSGLMARILRALEGEGLILMSVATDDARRRIATPTERGRDEIAEYDRLSDDRAGAILAAHGKAQDRLLEAMDMIAVTLLADRITTAAADPEGAEAQDCLAAYFAELAAQFAGGFDPGPGPHSKGLSPPEGIFLLASADGLPVGCVGLVPGPDGRTREVKRLWVAPAARGIGLARRLMAAVEGRARAMGAARLVLDTNGGLTGALALYRGSGWAEIPRYNDNPYAQHWFEKAL